MAVLSMKAQTSKIYYRGISDYSGLVMYYPSTGEPNPSGGYTQEITSENDYWGHQTVTHTVFITDTSTKIIYGIMIPKTSVLYDFIYREKGQIKSDTITPNYKNFTIDVKDIFTDTGISSLSVTADSGINSILYNSVTYDTFPATIPLDPAANTMQVESKSPVVTINDGGNLKSVTYGSATFTKFPATVTATTSEFAVTARGKDSPVITVRTERTQTPVITNT